MEKTHCNQCGAVNRPKARYCSDQYNDTLVGIDKSQVNTVTLVYSYRDQNGVFVHRIVITPEMYK